MKNSQMNKISEFLKLRLQYQEIKEAYEEAEAAIKELLADVGGKVEVDGHSLTLVESERRSFDAEALKELVSASVFRKVTEPTVKPKLIDAAISIGAISHDVLDKVMSVTPYTQLRVK